jgi:hypothetical protein
MVDGHPFQCLEQSIVTDGTGMDLYWIGAPGGIQTPDPRFRRPMLYSLSYGREDTAQLEGRDSIKSPAGHSLVTPRFPLGEGNP